MNAKAFVGFLCAMITIIDIIMQVLERVGILNLICVLKKYKKISPSNENDEKIILNTVI